MLSIHVAQVVFAALVVRRAFRKLIELVWRDRADATSLQDATTDCLEQRDDAGTNALAAEFQGTHLGRILESALDADSEGIDLSDAVDEAILAVRHDIIEDVRLIRGMATIASAGGLLGAMAHYFLSPPPDPEGLSAPALHARAAEAAQAAQAAQTAQGAMLSMALGLGTALILHACSSQLRRAVRRRLSEVDEFGSTLRRELAARGVNRAAGRGAP